jgi:hypothetical protein
LFDAMQLGMRDDAGERRNPLDRLVELPEDLEAWAAGEGELS